MLSTANMAAAGGRCLSVFESSFIDVRACDGILFICGQRLEQTLRCKSLVVVLYSYTARPCVRFVIVLLVAESMHVFACAIGRCKMISLSQSLDLMPL